MLFFRKLSFTPADTTNGEEQDTVTEALARSAFRLCLVAGRRAAMRVLVWDYRCDDDSSAPGGAAYRGIRSSTSHFNPPAFDRLGNGQ